MKKRQSTNKGITDTTILTVSGGKLNYYSWNMLVLAGVPFCLTKFNQNPTFFGIVIGILILIIIPLNYVEYFIAENDKLIVFNKSVFFLSFLNKKQIFNFNEINKVIVVIKINERAYLMNWVLNLTNKIKLTTSNTLEIELKNGKKNSIATKIVKEKLIPIIDFLEAKGVRIQTIYPNNKNILLG